jgi:hypothetical protein
MGKYSGGRPDSQSLIYKRELPFVGGSKLLTA